MTSEYKLRFDALMLEFPNDFKDRCETDMTTCNVFESLMQGYTPYQVIDYLLNERGKTMATLKIMSASENPEKGQLIFDKNNPSQARIENKLK